MKQPVDTSKWGEFKVGELFDVKLSDGDNKPKKLPKGNIPLVSAGTTNNGIVGYFESDTIIFPAGSLTADMFGQVFYQPNDFQTVSHGRVNILVPKQELSPKIGHFIVTILNNVCKKYSFTEMLTSKKLQAEAIPLPLKQGTNPTDYTQEDIDWDYMENFMSRVQDAAKKRLANLPEPRQKSKTPVDVSKWGEFKVGELFDMFPGRRLKKGDFEDGDIPFVMASSYNNGVVTTLSNPISMNENFLTADIFGNVFYQKELVGYGDDNCGLKLKYRDGRPNEYLFLATMISSISVQASFTNKLRGTWYIEQTILLPLKPYQGDYSQEDIDWDYMESFMSKFQNLAKNRVEQLTQT